MAARETGFGAVEQYMHAGKLLALELLVRVFENPHHHWTSLRPEARCLRSSPCLICGCMHGGHCMESSPARSGSGRRFNPQVHAVCKDGFHHPCCGSV